MMIKNLLIEIKINYLLIHFIIMIHFYIKFEKTFYTTFIIQYCILCN